MGRGWKRLQLTIDVVQGFFNCSVVRQRTDINPFFGPRTDLECLDPRAEFVRKFMVDAFLDKNAVCGDASLTGIPEFSVDARVHRGLEISIVEDDERRVSAQLEGQFFQGGAALAREQFAYTGASCKAQLAHEVVLTQGLADLGYGVEGGDYVDGAFGEASLVCKNGLCKCAQGSFAGRFPDGCTPGCQSGADLACDHGDGEVPGGETRCHTNGLLEGQNALIQIGGWDDLAVDSFRVAGKPFKEGSSIGDFAFCFGKGLAILQGQDQGQIIDVGQAEIAPFAKPSCSLACAGFLVGLESGVGCSDGLVHVNCIHLWDGGYFIQCCWIVNGKGRPRRGSNPLIIDEALGLQQILALEVLECFAHDGDLESRLEREDDGLVGSATEVVNHLCMNCFGVGIAADTVELAVGSECAKV